MLATLTVQLSWICHLYKKQLIPSPLTPYSENYLQATNISISLENHNSITISSIYCPPGAKITTENFKNYFSSLGQQFIAGGDLNSKHPTWGNKSACTRGRTLNYVLTSKTYSVLSPLVLLTGLLIVIDYPTSSTYSSQKSQTI